MKQTNRVYRIAVIAGDGIGKEVVPEGVRVLEAAASRHGFALQLDSFDFASCDYYQKHGRRTGRSKSAVMTRSSLGRSAGPKPCQITYRSGVR
jgi:isocitrate/isopropylmalate dehydrogenase